MEALSPPVSQSVNHKQEAMIAWPPSNEGMKTISETSTNGQWLDVVGVDERRAAAAAQASRLASTRSRQSYRGVKSAPRSASLGRHSLVLNPTSLASTCTLALADQRYFYSRRKVEAKKKGEEVKVV